MVETPSLSIRINSMFLKHPFMNASGILAINTSGVLKLLKANVSAIVTKTLTLEPRRGYDTPITIPVYNGLLNAVGLENPGINGLKEIIPYIKKYNVPLIPSIGGRNREEFQQLAVKALENNIDAIELNLSCPHTIGYGYQVSSSIKEIVRDVKSVSDKPVWVKLGYSRELLREAGEALEGGADAIVLINTLPAMAIDPYIMKPILSNKYGGLSGPPIHPIAVYSVYTVYREYRCNIIGVGGVVDWETAVEFFLAGARAIQIGTGFYLRGINIINEILEDLKKYMERQGFRNIEELIGRAHKS